MKIHNAGQMHPARQAQNLKSSIPGLPPEERGEASGDLLRANDNAVPDGHASAANIALSIGEKETVYILEENVAARTGESRLRPTLLQGTTADGIAFSMNANDKTTMQGRFLKALATGNMNNVFSDSYDKSGGLVQSNVSSDYLSDYADRYDALYKQIENMDASDETKDALVKQLDSAMKMCARFRPVDESNPWVAAYISGDVRSEQMPGTYGDQMADAYSRTFIEQYKASNGDKSKAHAVGIEAISKFTTTSLKQLSYKDFVALSDAIDEAMEKGMPKSKQLAQIWESKGFQDVLGKMAESKMISGEMLAAVQGHFR